ncbi:Flagellar hook-basal body complex protein FliE OS=Castellaniella defragrans OX=75697 GN=fliE PE=3 SV=1 [Castellaniella defragrans]
MITSVALSRAENLLAQMRSVAQAAQGAGPERADSASPAQGGFAAELTRSLNRVSQVQNSAAAQAQAFELGDPGVALSNVMIDMQKANLAFQATVQVRNRLVDAYKEIANLSI